MQASSWFQPTLSWSYHLSTHFTFIPWHFFVNPPLKVYHLTWHYFVWLHANLHVQKWQTSLLKNSIVTHSLHNSPLCQCLAVVKVTSDVCWMWVWVRKPRSTLSLYLHHRSGLPSSVIKDQTCYVAALAFIMPYWPCPFVLGIIIITNILFFHCNGMQA